MGKVVWFLDVDGVINRFPKPSPVVIEEDGLQNVRVNGYPIWYNPVVIDFINELHDSGKVEVRWLTTWENDARTLLGPAVGIKHDFEVEVAESGLSWPKHSDWWKAIRVRLYLQENQDVNVIWTDDDLSWHIAEPGVQQELRDENKHLLVAPIPHLGLAPKHLDLIRSFAERHAFDKFLIV